MAYFRILFILCLAFLSGCSNSTRDAKDQLFMDTFVRIEIRDPMARGARKLVIDRVFATMKKLEKKFDYFSDDSELAVINRLKSDQKLPVSKEMFLVLKKAKEISLRTGGVFDVTMGGGGFRLSREERSVYFRRDGVKIDLGGIAKGFIVDEGVRLLRKLGIRNALINAGGDMYCMGEGPGGGWKVGIRSPRNRRQIVDILKVQNKGVATSGGYERLEKRAGQKFSHIINPKTRRPVKDIYKSVTVIADDCVTADALATALYVMEPGHALSLIKRIEGATCVIIGEDGRMYVSSEIPQQT